MQGARSTDEGDFQGFVAARWPGLVRALVLIGCPAELAPDVVVTGLSRCRRGWREAVERDDPDVVAYVAVLGAWDERRRGPWWTGLRPEGVGDQRGGPDLSTLDRMTSPVRTGVVLRRYAGLDPSQAVAVAGREAGGELPAAPEPASLRAVAESVPVLAPPDEQTLTGVQVPWRRRRGVLTFGGVAALAVVLGAWAAVATWPDEAPPQATAVELEALDPQRAPNPAAVAWYADGVLHLANATYALPTTLRDLAVLGAGAVYGDADGRVVHLADDGVRTLLGTKDPGVAFATSDQLGWVAWVDPAGASPRLFVYDVARAEIVGELDLPESESGPQEEPDTRPVAIDQDAVYFVTSAGARAWRPTRDPGYVESLQLPRLLDVASANQVFQIGSEVIAVDQPFVARSVTMPGRGGELSADGHFLLTHDPANGLVLVLDVRTGGRLAVQPPEGADVVDAVLAPEGSVTYLTIGPDGYATRDGNDSNPMRGELMTCGLDDGQCEVLAILVLDSEAPILAR